MGMGVVTDKDFNKELEHNSIDPISPEVTVVEGTVINGSIEKLNPQGRKEGSIAVPEGLRKLIAETAISQGRPAALQLAETLGISASSASAYAVGATSTSSYNQPDTSLKATVNDAKLRVVKRARSKLMMALGHITEDKLQEAKVKDLAGIARDMSAVIKNMEPETPKDAGVTNNGPTFLLYAPKFNDESIYGITHARD